jgi:predicted GIY-YIG superfamily endonuclease
MSGAYVYILANCKHGAVYVGVTRYIEQRTIQH